MTVRSVWFWAPFHMLQAYPMTRVLPLPDFIVPFSHLLWVVFYIAEHWTGLADPVEPAFAFSQAIFSKLFQLGCLTSFFYFTHQMSNNKTVVKIGIFLYFGFMFGAKRVGLIGSPKGAMEDQIAANADPKWNNHHVILHVWYLTILWVVTLTVPYERLATRGKAEKQQ